MEDYQKGILYENWENINSCQNIIFRRILDNLIKYLDFESDSTLITMDDIY